MDIKVNLKSVHAHASEISKAAGNCKKKSIGSVDGRSTIKANKKSVDAFNASQKNISAFSSALKKEASNIESIGNNIKMLDDKMGRDFLGKTDPMRESRGRRR